MTMTEAQEIARDAVKAGLNDYVQKLFATRIFQVTTGNAGDARNRFVGSLLVATREYNLVLAEISAADKKVSSP